PLILPLSILEISEVQPDHSLRNRDDNAPPGEDIWIAYVGRELLAEQNESGPRLGGSLQPFSLGRLLQAILELNETVIQRPAVDGLRDVRRDEAYSVTDRVRLLPVGPDEILDRALYAERLLEARLLTARRKWVQYPSRQLALHAFESRLRDAPGLTLM